MDRFHAGEGHGYQGTPRRSERFRALQGTSFLFGLYFVSISNFDKKTLKTADASQATEGAHCQRRVGQVEVQEINELQHRHAFFVHLTHASKQSGSDGDSDSSAAHSNAHSFCSD